MKFSITMLKFMRQFPDDGACRAYLEKMRWPNGFVCSRCQGTNASYVASRRLRQCTTCRYQASVTAGTIFMRRRLRCNLDCYLKEFIYRFNRRWNEDKLFYYLTRRAVDATPLPYHRLIAEPIG